MPTIHEIDVDAVLNKATNEEVEKLKLTGDSEVEFFARSVLSDRSQVSIYIDQSVGSQDEMQRIIEGAIGRQVKVRAYPETPNILRANCKGADNGDVARQAIIDSGQFVLVPRHEDESGFYAELKEKQRKSA